MNSLEIGRQLRKAREELGHNLQKASRETKIRDYYLQALEEGKFEQLPSKAQVRGFIKGYARFLGLDENQILLAGLDEEKVGIDPGDGDVKAASGENEEQVEGRDRESVIAASFAKMGKLLKERREILDLSIEEISDRTHIAKRYIQWIENGDYLAFPSPTQARGMLNNYAGFLGLKQKALEQFGDALQTDFEERRESEQKIPKPYIPENRKIRLPKWAQRYLSVDILVGVGLTAILAIIFIWGLGQVLGIRADQTSPPTAPPLAEVLLPSASVIPSATASPTIELEEAEGNPEDTTEAESVPQITIQVANPSGVEVQIFPVTREWVRISVDGAIEFEGRITPRQNLIFSGNNEVIIFTGNAAAFRIFLNNRDLGFPGIEGEVIEMLFTREGLATPSPVPTATIDANILTETSSAFETEAASTPVD